MILSILMHGMFYCKPGPLQTPGSSRFGLSASNMDLNILSTCLTVPLQRAVSRSLPKRKSQPTGRTISKMKQAGSLHCITLCPAFPVSVFPILYG